MENIGEYQYNKKDLIGHGAFAVVFKGQIRKDPDKKVAIKCITKKNLAKSAALLSKEIKILKELSHLKHENVVGLLDCKETSHHVYLVMEFCNGGDLADYLQVKGTLSEDTISLFLRQIAAAVKALVGKGVVHRDLKPQNILLCHSGEANPPPSTIRLKIADFGFARFLQDGVMAATLCGSPMYMAPEVIMSLQYCAKADLWSVGTIVYQCLTGKAPFQAQTPQQLKQYYERNANLAPVIPAGTSPELRDLLMRLLKRNAKDRIDFEDFFSHVFMQPKKQYSEPVPVPRSRSKASVSESPVMQAISASPLSSKMAETPPRQPELPPPVPSRIPSRVVTVGKMSYKPVLPEPMDESGNEVPMEQEGFVLVPDNLPTNNPDGTAAKQVDLNAIFSDVAKEKSAPIAVPGTGAHSRANQPSPENLSTSPNRPSTLPMEVPVSGRPSSEPIPVPTQRKNYEMIQQSIGQSPSPGTYSDKYSPVSPRPSSIGSHGQSTGSNAGVAYGSAPRLSCSPPRVQFHVGTPPQGGAGHPHYANINPPHQTPPSPRRSTIAGFSRVSTMPSVSGTPPLPTIAGSPSRQNLPALPTVPTVQEQTSVLRQRGRTRTCPDIGAVGFHVQEGAVRPLSADMADTGVGRHNPHSSTLTQQLVRAALQTSIPSPPTSGLAAQLTAQTPPGILGNNQSPGGAVLNLGASPGGVFNLAQSPPGVLTMPFGGSNGSLHRAGSNTSLTRVRKYSVTETPESIGIVTESSPKMEGPVSFIAPDLAEETLMDSTHNDTVHKINFILALVECIVEIANVKSSILSESIIGKNFENIVLDKELNNTGCANPTACSPLDENRLEELMLMIRALQLLGATIQMAKDEIQYKRLHPSTVVKTILTEMTQHYHKCLMRCKELHKLGVLDNANMNATDMAHTADRIIYSYAIEMCQTAALGELFGNPQECFHHYRNAHILLHSLAEKADDDKDKEVLNKYRESVEQRIQALYNKGLIDSLNTHRNASSNSS